jgi:hypothetical protein
VNKRPDDDYTNGTQQCCLGFILDTLSTGCQNIQNSFRIQFTEKHMCNNCKNEVVFNETHSTLFISLSRKLNVKEIDFENLFDASFTDLKCKNCGFAEQMICNEYTLLGKFLIICISNEDIKFRLNTKIKNINFNNNNLKFPNVGGVFKCKSAIVHIANSSIKSNTGGHYKCYSRIVEPNETNFNWLEISDSACTPKISLPEDLKDVFLMLFEKHIN